MGKKIEWLSVLQGWSMLLVVIGHVTLTGKFADPSTPLPSMIEQGIYKFHMPLFMFISGWLFYYTALSRNKTYKEVLVNKLQRLGMPFLAFTLATTLLKIVAAPLMKRTVDLNELINTFVLFKSNPLGEMWFIITLFVLMAMYPIYQQLLKNRITECCGLIFALGIYFFFPRSINYFQLDKVAGMMIFFFTGILSCKYNLHDILSKNTALCVSLLAFISLLLVEITPPHF